jgi:hypothetical protein
MRRTALAALFVIAAAGCGGGHGGPTGLDDRGLDGTPVVRVIAQDAIPAIDRRSSTSRRGTGAQACRLRLSAARSGPASRSR